MDWSEILFELVILSVTIIAGMILYYVVPYIKSKTTSEQRKDLIYWSQLVIKIAEDLYKKNWKGKAKSKKNM